MSEKRTKILFLTLLILYFILSAFMYFRHINVVLIDYGREFIIPEAMASGKLLYKDILCFYPPLGFYINALIFKLFTPSLDLLYMIGLFVSGIFAVLFYLVCRELFDFKYTIVLTFLALVFFVFTGEMFAFTNPYSFSIVYGLVAGFGSLLMLIKFYKNRSMKFAYLASLFAGVSISCKIEYFLIPVVVLFGFILLKMRFFDILKSFLCFCIAPVLITLYMLHQGITTDDLISAWNLFKVAAKGPNMIWFHKFGVGIYPTYLTLFEGIYQTIFFVLEILTSYWLYKKFSQLENKKLGLILTCLCSILLFYVTNTFHRYLLLAVLLTIGLIFNIKYLYKENKLCLLVVLFAIAASVKTFWYCAIFWQNGNYTAPFLMIGFLFFISVVFKDMFEKHKTFILLMLFSIGMSVWIYSIYHWFDGLNYKLTGKYELYTNWWFARDLQETITWVANNTEEGATIIAYPEGEIINIMADRPADLILYSPHAIMIDTLGVDNVINRIKNEKTPYIIYIRRASEGHCNDFTNDNYYPELTNYLLENYKTVYASPSYFYIVFKLKDKT